MTHDACIGLSSEVVSARRVTDKINVTSPYSDVFRTSSSNGVTIVNCVAGFDQRYEIPYSAKDAAGRRGKYPTLPDFRNIFHIGIDYGKYRAVGGTAEHSSDIATAIGGFPPCSLVWDGSRNRYISLQADNKAPLPSGGTENKYWIPYAPVPVFLGAGQSATGKRTPNMSVYRLKIDAPLPTVPSTVKKMVRSFKGSDIGLAGAMVFTPTFGIASVGGRIAYGRVDYCEPENITNSTDTTSAKFMLKISPYSDIYDNEDHADSFIEVYSHSRYRKNVPNNSITWECRSPHMLIPISADTTYYLYMEFENAYVWDAYDAGVKEGKPIYLYCYLFRRALRWPGSLTS